MPHSAMWPSPLGMQGCAAPMHIIDAYVGSQLM
jgi:hypothetical protein